MLDHVIVTVRDFARSIAFYQQALKPLGITDFHDYKGQDGPPDLKGFGNDGRFFFWLKEGRLDPDTVHVGFVAKSLADRGGRQNDPRRPPAAAFIDLRLTSSRTIIWR
jgi:catechol 2,3-dioxygenase-like lactoylglutathione lyase family enzyme